MQLSKLLISLHRDKGMTGYIVGAIVAALEFAILCVWVYLCRHNEEVNFLEAFGMSIYFVFAALVGFCMVHTIPAFFPVCVVLLESCSRYPLSAFLFRLRTKVKLETILGKCHGLK